MIALVVLGSIQSSVQMAEARTSALEARLERVVAEANIPAAAVAIVESGRKTSFLLFGKAVTTRTPFRWGSVTKTFTAITLMKAAEAANVSLETPLSDVVPRPVWENPYAPQQPVRLSHLTELSAGMADLTRRAFSDNRPLPLGQALTEHGDSLVVRWPPGVTHSYTNASPGLSEAAVESLTGRPFERAMTDLVFLPLGMTRAALSPVSGLPGGFRADGQTPIPYWHNTFKAFGALNASIAELAELLSALLRSGADVWSSPIQERLLRPHTGLAAEAGLHVGYAAGVYSRVVNGRVWHGHGGDADGYRSRYAFLPDAGRGYAVVINTDNPGVLRRMERLIERTLTNGLPAPPAASAHPVPTETLRAFTGCYYPVATRFSVPDWTAGRSAEACIHLEGEALRFEYGQTRTKLRPAGPGLFAREDDPLPTVALIQLEAGRYIVGELGTFRASEYRPPRRGN